MANNNYGIIESSFIDLLASITTEFSDVELREIRELLNANEYGLALQTFVDIVVEEKKLISYRTVTICEELARLMELTGEVDLQAVRGAAL